METKPESQDGVWEGEGPQSSGASPTVTCEFEAQPERCMFPECPCASVPLAIADDGDIPPFLQRNKPTAAEAAIAGCVGRSFNDSVARVLTGEPKRKPKRDRAKYMRDYRARTSAARTQ